MNTTGTTPRKNTCSRRVLLVVVTPVVTGPDHLGYVTFASRGPVPAIGRALGRVASVIALILLGHRARDEANNRVRGELLAEVLAPGEHDLDAIGRRAALLGVDVDTDLVALVITPAEERMPRALQAECRALARAEADTAGGRAAYRG